MTEAVRALVLAQGHPDYRPTEEALTFAREWCRQYAENPADREQEIARAYDAGVVIVRDFMQTAPTVMREVSRLLARGQVEAADATVREFARIATVAQTGRA